MNAYTLTDDNEDAAPRKYRLTWAALLTRVLTRDLRYASTRRHGCNPATQWTLSIAFRMITAVFKIQADVCPHCGGKMRIVAAVTEPDSARRYLKGMCLPSDVPMLARPERPRK
ncbi:MAG: hypothetical protein GY854_33865 [Deltaproteobacteria bacterium]|nr:hypothetical protein [Deltaproteobacteria bacterium]